jgi:ABC-type transporter Mla subunit MlaD
MDILNAIELPEDVKASLIAELESKYVAKDEFDKVLRSKNELLDETKKVKLSKKELEDAAEKARMDAAVKTSDIDSLRSSYEEKLSKLSGEIAKYNDERKTNSLSTVANSFVQEHIVDDAFSREAMSKEFSKRLDLRDGELVVLDPQGNLTALTVDDLKSEFLNNSKYAKMITGSKASGGGATKGSDKIPGAGGTKKSLSEIAISDKAGRLAAIRAKLNK